MLGSTSEQELITLVPFPKKVYVGALSISLDSLKLPRAGTDKGTWHCELSNSEKDKDVTQGLVETLLKQDGHKVTYVGDESSAYSPDLTLSISEISYNAMSSSVSSEFYKIVFDGKKHVLISGHSRQACIWGLQTLRQLLRQCNTSLSQVDLEIHDWPIFPTRGYLLDISRDRVPTLAELYNIVNFMSSCKLNHLELYMEHTYAYEGHECVWKDSSPLHAKDLKRLDKFCTDRGICLVPNQNTLGHMSRWLRHEKYRNLAEVQEGMFHFFSEEKEPFSLCPTDPMALELCRDLLSQLTPNFAENLRSVESGSKPLIHVNLDEPFDLGRRHARSGHGNLAARNAFERHVRGIYQICQHRLCHPHRMMMWADGICTKETLAAIPSDCILIEWGYEENHSWSPRLDHLRSMGHEVWVAPGTSSWGSVGGRTSNSLSNLRQAAAYGLAKGATGILIADWGDFGHHQQPVISIIPLVAGCVHAWSPDVIQPNSSRKTNDFQGMDEDTITRWCSALNVLPETCSRTLYRLGNVFQLLPKLPNMSLLWLALRIAEPIQNNHVVRFAIEQFTPFSYPAHFLRCSGPLLNSIFKMCLVRRASVLQVRAFAQSLLQDQQEITNCPQWRSSLWQADCVLKQIHLSIRMVNFLCDLWIAREEAGIHKPATAASQYLNEVEVESLITEYVELWQLTSQPGGCKNSVEKLRRAAGQVPFPAAPNS